MRRALGFLLVLAVALAGCGGDERQSAVDHARGFLDPRDQLVLTVDLDYDGEQWEQIKALYARFARDPAVRTELLDDDAPATLDRFLEQLTRDQGLSFAEDIRPLLTGTLVVGLRVEPGAAGGGGMTYEAVYRTEADALEELLPKLRRFGIRPRPARGLDDVRVLDGGVALVGKDTLVVYQEEPGALRRLVEGPPLAAGRLPAERDALFALRTQPGILGDAGFDPDVLRRVLATPAGQALRKVDVSLRLDEDAARAETRVDFEGLAAEELPLTEARPLELPDAGFASATADQSRFTVFLSRLMRAAFPDSRFVQRVERLERATSLRFEDAVLRQFSGPSFSILEPGNVDGFAARSTLRDPAAMRALLPRIAPSLPGILTSLDRLGRTGLAGLLFVAPDAPLTPQTFGAPDGVQIRTLPRPGDDVLYLATGFNEAQAPDLPEQVVFGVVGDAFVVGSSEQLARRAVSARTEPAEPAGTRLRIEAEGLRALDPVAAAVLDRVEADASAQGGDIVAHGEARWRR